MRRAYSRFSASVFPAILFLFLGPVIGVLLGERYGGTASLLMTVVCYAGPAVVGFALFFASLRLQCADCGATGGVVFGMRHACEEIRRRREEAEPLTRPEQSKVFLVMVFVFLAFLLVIGLLSALSR